MMLPADRLARGESREKEQTNPFLGALCYRLSVHLSHKAQASKNGFLFYGGYAMSKTILANVDGFTPIIDGMVKDVGIMTAAVFGKAWRYCQMTDGVCKASQDRMADELGISRATVNAHISKLVEVGYLIDKTPELVGVPHVYADTGKANLSISFTATCQNSLQPPVKNIDTKIVLKKEIINAEPTKQIQKHGDLVQGYIEMSQMPGMKKTIRIDNLESIVKVKTGVEPTRKAWKPFLEFVDSRQQEKGQMLTEFLDWLQSTPKFDISFWGPDRMRENWDRAFESATKITTSADGGMYV